MRGPSTTWIRIRVNLRNVPEEIRPHQEALEVDYDPWQAYRGTVRRERRNPGAQ